MSWSTSNRRDRLPPDWQSRRRKRLRADNYLCQWVLPDNTLCLDTATDVDHINPGDDHSHANLQSLCHMHHARKSSSEGGVAAAKVRRQNGQKFRRVEQHPGSL